MYSAWVKAIDLQQWAPRNEARFTLPALVRRLVWATTTGKRVFSFPAGEGVQRPSWDGRLEVQTGNVWVPDQSSVWELSTGASPAAKAAENYKKRTAATPVLEAGQLTFVFVTPLKWPDRQTWSDARKAEGVWKDVRVLDSDDLEHWLEIAPAVDIWLARLLGKAPAGTQDMTHHWKLVAALTKPPLPPTAFLAGRKGTRDELSKALLGEPGEIPVAASSEQELVDFVAAAFGSLGEDHPLPARLILVETSDAWNQIATSAEAIFLLPLPGLSVSRTAVTQAVTAGHHVITRRPYSTQNESGVIRLPRAWRHELSEALVTAGFAEEHASRLARECGGYLDVLQRLAVPNSGTVAPIWAQDPNGDQLGSFVLFGAWDDSKDADREVVAQFTGVDYDQTLALVSGWLVKPASPFRRSGTEWHLVSREDTWIHLAPCLSRTQLDHFRKVAVSVLSEDDPRFELDSEQRAFAALHGKLPRHSSELRDGLAETLALLGADLIPLPSLPVGSGPGYARSIVRELLSGDLTTRRWFTLSPILKLLAEAAPEEFLDALERDLETSSPALAGLLTGDDGGIFDSSRHYHLMWALTSLAWHPSYLARATLVLSRLAILDPGGNTSPRPAGSLHDIFRPWFPQTGANAAQRFEVIDLLVDREPDQGWRLLMELLPKGHDHASGTYPPRWREWPSAKTPRVTRQEEIEQCNWTAERLLKLALKAPARLHEITKEVDHLPDKEFDALSIHLSELNLEVLPKSERFELWNCLHGLIRRHEYFDDAEWRMTDKRLRILGKVEFHLRPETPTDRGGWLFAQHHLFMGTHRHTSHEEQKAMALEQRKNLLVEIFEAGGIEAVANFAATLSVPGLVGNVLAQTSLCADSMQILPEYLEGSNPKTTIFGSCYAAAIFEQRGWDWIDTLPLETWGTTTSAQLLVHLPFVPRTWDLAQSLGSDVETAYWTEVRPFPRDLTSAQATRALERLLQHNRQLEAADYLGLVYHNRLAVPAALLAETMEKCVPALNDAAANHDVSNLIHELREVLGHLQDAPDSDPIQVAHLEWTYLPLMKHSQASPKFLQRELARDPAFFAQCVELIWRKDVPDDDPADKSEDTKAKAKLAHDLLDSWGTHPALLVEGGPDQAALRTWVDEVRRLCAASGRVNACAHDIGKLLASSPKEDDGSWPCIAVRNVLESIPGDIALDSFQTAVFNARGGTSRGVRDGGEQERELTRQYHDYADACQMRWPRTSATLRGLARTYEADARRMDEEADDRV